MGLGIGLALFTWNEVSRKDTTERFVYLCGRLFEDLPADSAPTVKPTQEEQEAKVLVDFQDLKDEIRRISRHGRKLAPIAKDYSALIAQLEELARNATQISGSKMVFGLAEAVLGGYTGKKDLLASGGEQTLHEAEKAWNLYSALKNLIHQKRVFDVQLVGLAPQFSGQVTTNNSLLACVFSEHTPGFFEVQTRRALSLANSSGKDLHNCVVAVRLSNNSGDSYSNHYFVQEWQNNETRVAQFLDKPFREITVDHISRVEVSFWAAEFSIQPIVIEKPLFGWPEPR